MGSATTQVLSREEARAELESLRRDLGSIDDARERSRAGILPADQEPLLRRAEYPFLLLCPLDILRQDINLNLLAVGDGRKAIKERAD